MQNIYPTFQCIDQSLFIMAVFLKIFCAVILKLVSFSILDFNGTDEREMFLKEWKRNEKTLQDERLRLLHLYDKGIYR